MGNGPRYKLLLAAAAAVFIAAVLAGSGAPLAEWDWFFLEAAKNWAAGIPETWVFDYPPTYPVYLSVPFRFFPASPETARMANALPVMVTAWLVYLAGKRFSGRSAGWAAALLFLINPVTIQGTASIAGADSSLLPMLFILVPLVLTQPGSGSLPKSSALSVVFALALWAKVSSSLALMAGCGLYLLAFHRSVGRQLRAEIVRGIAGGALLFVISWSVVSLPLWGADSWSSALLLPFRYFSRETGTGLTGMFLKWGMGLARTIFWFSPFLLYFSFTGIRQALRDSRSVGPLQITAFACAIYFVAHIFIGGSNHGFPRYHAPVSPLLHVFAGMALAGSLERPGAVRGLLLPAAVFLLAALGIGCADPLLLLNLKLKQLAFAAEYGAAAVQVVLPLIAFAAFPFAAGALWRGAVPGRSPVSAAVLAALIGTCLALAVRQGLAGYATSYQYGKEGKAAVVELLSARLSGGEVLMATPEFVYELRPRQFESPDWNQWWSEKGMYEFASVRAPEFIVAGWTTHTLGQLRYLFTDARMKRLLEEKYVLSEIGTCFVWERKR